MNDASWVRTVGICGLGLIGSSAARAFAARGVEVLGLDPDPPTSEHAGSLGVRPVSSMAELAGVDLILLAAPTKQNVEFLGGLQEVGPFVPTMDLGSVKAPIVDVWHADGGRFPFVATHPMAGSELAGFDAGSADLFSGASWPVVIDALTDPHALVLTLRTIRSFGAFPVPVTAAAHDVVVAQVSHLPHLLAGALGRATEAGPYLDLALRLAAGSFRDITRVCVSPPSRTAEFVAANSERAAEMARLAAADLLSAANMLDADDTVGLEQWIAPAHAARASFDQLLQRPGRQVGHVDAAALRSHMSDLVDTGAALVDLRSDGSDSLVSTWSPGDGA